MARMPWEITPEMFLSLDEMNSLLDHVRRSAQQTSEASPQLDRVIIETLLFSGIRNSEICRLTLGDFITNSGGSVLHIQGTGEESRDVYLPSCLGELLREYVAGLRRELLPKGAKSRDASQPLIFNDKGKPYERTGLYRRVIRILTDAGLGDRASVQLLRHTYGFLAYKQTGGNLLFVQRQLGHAHPMITSVYARLVDERYEDLAEMLCPESPSRTGPSRRSK